MYQLGKNFLFQERKLVRVAEKAGHADEQVLVEPVQFVLVSVQKIEVVLEAGLLAQGHAPPQAPIERGRFVSRKINPGLPLEQHQKFFHVGGVRRPFAGRLGRGRQHVGMAAEPAELLPDAIRRENEIHTTRADGAARHAVISGGLFILGKGDAALGFDGLQAKGAIAGRAGKNDANSFALLVLGQGFEKDIDGAVQSGAALARLQLEYAPRDEHAHVGRYDVDVIWLDGHAAAHFGDRQGGRPGQQFGQGAGMRRVQVLDEHQTHAGVFRQAAEQLRKSLQSAR